MNAFKNRMVIVTLLCLFVIFNSFIYFQKSSGAYRPVGKMSSEAIEGEKLWQQNNCTACHQLYGLGGYLGPDLTNVISNPSKGEDYVKAFLNSGVQSMPEFKFDKKERNQIVAFLSHVDKTGIYPNTNAVFTDDGWVHIEYKEMD